MGLLRATLRAVEAATATTGVVRGTVSSMHGGNVAGTTVFLYQPTTHEGAQSLPVAADGRYSVAGLAPGVWNAYCNPPSSSPHAEATLSKKRGIDYLSPTAIAVIAGKSITTNFKLAPAGQLGVRVVRFPDAFHAANQTPVEGAMVLAFGPSDPATPVCHPGVTNRDGFVIIPNVPMKVKLLVVAPNGAAVYLPRTTSFAGASVVTLPGPGRGLLLSATVAGK